MTTQKHQLLIFYIVVWSITAIILLTVYTIANGEVAYTKNFTVNHTNQSIAEAVAQTAEHCRLEFAICFTGQPLEDWEQPCIVILDCRDKIGDGATTKWVFTPQGIKELRGNWQGKPETILQDVVPHEVLHLVLASWLGRPLPRWLGEGLASTVESDRAQAMFRSEVIKCLQTGRGIAFNKMFGVVDYPADAWPFYVQSHSIVEFFLTMGDVQTLLNFAVDGTNSKNWRMALTTRYGYQGYGDLQAAWLEWVSTNPIRHTVNYCKLKRLFRWLFPYCIETPQGKQCVPGRFERIIPTPPNRWKATNPLVLPAPLVKVKPAPSSSSSITQILPRDIEPTKEQVSSDTTHSSHSSSNSNSSPVGPIEKLSKAITVGVSQASDSGWLESFLPAGVLTTATIAGFSFPPALIAGLALRYLILRRRNKRRGGATDKAESFLRDSTEAAQFLQLSQLEGRSPLHDALIGRLTFDELQNTIDREPDGPEAGYARTLRDRLSDRFNEMAPLALKPQLS